MSTAERYSRPTGRRARRPSVRAGVPRALAEAPALPALLASLGVLLFLAVREGGYAATTWYPAGLIVLALLAVWVAAVQGARPHGRAVGGALVLLSGFAAWAYASISWADDAGAAWDGANRAALYAGLFALFCLWPLRARHARWVLTALGLGIATLGLVELVRFAAASDPGSFLIGGRFSAPVDYQNGNVALWLVGAFPCLWLASSREAHPTLRAVALGATVLLASLALMGQSRGSFFALPLALLLFFALAPDRLRLLVALLAAAAGVAAVAGPALELADVSGLAALRDVADEAATAILVAAGTVGAVGFVAALADRRWTPSSSAVRRTRTVVSVTLALLAGGAGVVAATQAGDLRREISERWEQFKSNDEAETGTARLGSAGTNRYDFWTVAWDSFEREPLRGVGIDNFQQDYLERGSSTEKPRFPHSLPVAIVSQTGIVGVLLLFGGLALAAFAAVAGVRRLPPPAAGAVAAAAAAFLYWLLHASVDWLYELPALGGLAFILVGLATTVRGDDDPSQPSNRGRTERLTRGAAVAGTTVVGLSFLLPWLAEREVTAAADVWRTTPRTAYDKLDRAADLNFLSARPRLVEGTIAFRLGELDRAERAFLAALDRNPRSAYAWLELGAIASARGDSDAAQSRLARAAFLQPRDAATRVVRERVARGEKVGAEQVNRLIVEYSRGGAD
jgi:hypothetical protein